MSNHTHQRRGAVIPLFALIFPVLLIFCSIAINLSYVQLTNTEMQVVVDVAVHAGGRRLGTSVTNDDGTTQTLDEATGEVMEFAAEIAAMNFVAGDSADIPMSAMTFGRSSRVNGRYQFTPSTQGQIPSSFRIISDDLEVPYALSAFTPEPTFTVNSSSVSTQVDRDVVLVLDRSGSMILFEDEDGLDDTLVDLFNETYTEYETQTVYEYRVIVRRIFPNSTRLPGPWLLNNRRGPWSTIDQGVALAETSYNTRFWEISLDVAETYSPKRIFSETEVPVATRSKISLTELIDALGHFARRVYTDNVIYWLEDKENPNHTLGDNPVAWTDDLAPDEQLAKLTSHMAVYAHTHRHNYLLNYSRIGTPQAPAYSRWYHLTRSVDVFLNVLGGGVDPDGTPRDGTVQKEQIAILPFNSDPDNDPMDSDFISDFDYGLQDDGFPAAFVTNSNDPGYAEPYGGTTLSLRTVLAGIVPGGGTAIGDSLQEAAAILNNQSSRTRPFAAKTIVILSDGDNTRGQDPVVVAQQHIANADVLVHTITFTPGVTFSGRAAMQAVAEHGKGNHYHTDIPDELPAIFAEIANNLPTIVTE